MRQSRRSGLVARYVKWSKCACTYGRIQNGHYYYQTDWVTDASGSDTGRYVQGTTGYEIAYSGGQYVYSAAGDQTYVDAGNPGTVYEVSGTTLYKYTFFGSDGSYRFEHRSVVTVPFYQDVYTAGAYIGAVLASQGQYPDERKGYSYVTTEGEYVIMKDGEGNYYAYVQIG